MKVLSVASEIFPLVKTGGLADVAGALPQALKPLGVDMLPLSPGYPAVMAALEDYEVSASWDDLFGGPARLLWTETQGLELFVLEADHLYKRPGSIYLGPDGKDWPDNGPRFAALCKAGMAIGQGIVTDFMPDIIHCHDWQSGLIPAYVHYEGGPKTVMTIHNIAFQGRFPASFFPALGLPPAAFSVTGVEYYGDVGFLKAGLLFADRITTVSPSYAREILSPEMGMGLEGLLQGRSDFLSGIVNGIDTAIWNPAADKALQARYTAKDLNKRAKNKTALEARFKLDPGSGPLFTVISRLTNQKGMDILAELLPFLVQQGARLAVLGSGDAAIEADLSEGARLFPGKIGIEIGYDENLSHLMQGGADAILVPSRFEPCGLTQIYGLHYGCVPIVARVGGLADTVIDANDAALAAQVATGFQFAPVSLENFAEVIRRACRVFANQPVWKQLQKNGIKADVSWARSAALYAHLYKSLA